MRGDDVKAEDIIEYIYSGEVKNIIVDCDMGADGDDQFALAYALTSPDKVKVLSVNSAPYNDDADANSENGKAECEEIISSSGLDVPVFKGSADYITRTKKPIVSDAADNIRDTALTSEKPVFVVVTGCCTNVASALALYPEIRDKIIVVWLALEDLEGRENSKEYNYHGDIEAGKLLFSHADNLVIVCSGKTVAPFERTKDEVDALFCSDRPLASWLRRRFREIPWAHGLWDLCAEGLLILPDACKAEIFPRPRIGDDGEIASYDESRPIIAVNRNECEKIINDCSKRIHIH